MTIAYNFACVQTETLNFTFARQAVIVYFYDFSILQLTIWSAELWSAFYPYVRTYMQSANFDPRFTRLRCYTMQRNVHFAYQL